MYRIVWLPDNTGIVRGWKRVCGILDCDRGEWRQFLNYKGAVGYHDAVGYYFKAGLYTVHPFEKPMVAYHARYSTGPDPVSVGAIEPLFRE